MSAAPSGNGAGQPAKTLPLAALVIFATSANAIGGALAQLMIAYPDIELAIGSRDPIPNPDRDKAISVILAEISRVRAELFNALDIRRESSRIVMAPAGRLPPNPFGKG